MSLKSLNVPCICLSKSEEFRNQDNDINEDACGSRIYRKTGMIPHYTGHIHGEITKTSRINNFLQRNFANIKGDKVALIPSKSTLRVCPN